MAHEKSVLKRDRKTSRTIVACNARCGLQRTESGEILEPGGGDRCAAYYSAADSCSLSLSLCLALETACTFLFRR